MREYGSMSINKNVQILSIEGKDLLVKNYRVNKNTLYKGSLDDSMESDKLKTVAKSIIKFNKKKKTYSCICDFRRDGLNTCLCTCIQTLLRGHKYAYKSFLFQGCFSFVLPFSPLSQ